jgi:putative copper resistance protein D
MSFGLRSARFKISIAGALLAALLIFSFSRLSAQDGSAKPDHSGHDGMSTPMDDPAHMDHTHMDHSQMDAARQRKLLADKKESEFNHHLAGFFVVLAGIFILAQGALTRRWSFLRFAWPACFLLSGLFLLVFSDTELWPFGPQSWWYGLTHNLEDLQHKTFAVILLALGVIEVQRVRGVLKSAWAGWLFLVLACFGSVLLLFHEHHTGMHGPGHMSVMAHIQAQHLGFSVTGFGIGLVKGLSELPTRWKVTFARLWSLLMIVLGVLLILYTE